MIKCNTVHTYNSSSEESAMMPTNEEYITESDKDSSSFYNAEKSMPD